MLPGVRRALLAHPLAVDAVLVALVIVAGFAFPIGDDGIDPGSDRGPLAVFTLVVLAQALPVLARRRYPLVAVAAALAGIYLAPLLQVAESMASAGGSVALWSVAVQLRVPVSLAAAVVVALAHLPYFRLAGTSDQGLPRDRLGWYAMSGTFVIWGAGVAVRWSRIRAEDQRRRWGQQARVDERARIARELQEVVAQNVSTIVDQAGAAHRAFDTEPGQVREALASIQAVGGQTITAMRRLLGILRRADGPPAGATRPTLDRVGTLVDEYRRTGLAVTLTMRGEPVEVPPDVELCAFRIVQEALVTSARQGSVEVEVDYGRSELTVAVGGTASARPGRGRPDGLRERVARSGGELAIGTGDGSGWRVRARFPLARTPS